MPSPYSLRTSVTAHVYILYLSVDLSLKADIVSYFVSVRIKRKEERQKENCYFPLIPSRCTICLQFADAELGHDAESLTTWFQAAQLHLQALSPV